MRRRMWVVVDEGRDVPVRTAYSKLRVRENRNLNFVEEVQGIKSGQIEKNNHDGCIYMSDTEAAPQPAKAKRTMTPEARERMLANLAKGREAKLKKLSEAKKIRDEENDKKLRDLGVSEPMNARLTCPGCRKVFKHSSTKSTRKEV